MKSGNLNFLEHSGPLQACNGTAFTHCIYRLWYKYSLEKSGNLGLGKSGNLGLGKSGNLGLRKSGNLGLGKPKRSHLQGARIQFLDP